MFPVGNARNWGTPSHNPAVLAHEQRESCEEVCQDLQRFGFRRSQT